MATDVAVYTGFWINWSKGPISGATITTNGQHGFYLVSFLTLFVRMAGGHLWSIICFTIHQIKSSFEPQDGLHHQHQLLLRNSQSHTSTVWDLMKVAWYWRKRAKHSFGRTLPLIGLAMFHLVLFTAAAFFSSQIASTSDEVLMAENKYCGYLSLPSTPPGHYTSADLKQVTAYDVSTKMTATWSENYVRDCYLGSGDNSSCNLFAKAAIDLEYNYVSCPFGDDICIEETNGAFQVDTGYVNSDKDLGINSRKQDSVDYRRVTTCAPLKTGEPYSFSDFTDPYNPTLGFYYGDAVTNGGETQGMTFEYFWTMGTSNTSYKPAYILYNQYAGLDDVEATSFNPINALKRDDADVTLIFLVNFASYTAPVNDLWFNSTNLLKNVSDGAPIYYATLPVAVMGCTEQHQLCNPASGSCSPLTGASVLGNMTMFQGKQLAVVHHVFNAIDDNYLRYLTWRIGALALQASNYIQTAQTTISAALPDDQWVQEVKSWGAYAVAHMQRMIYQFAAAPQDSSWDQWILSPSAADRAELNVCAGQKVRSGTYYSFNLFGLLVTLVFGSLIVIINLSLSTCIGLVQRLTKRGIHRMEDWSLDHSLQVQRMAYENLGLGHWDGKEALVPVTAAGERFGKPTRQLPGQRLSSAHSQAEPLFSPYTPPSPYVSSSPYTPGQEHDPFFKQETGYTTNVTEMR